MNAYDDLHARFRRIGLFSDIGGILHWDTDVMLQPGSAETRGEQGAELDLLQHELTVDPAIGDLLAAAESDNSLDDWQRANLGEMRRSYRHATAVPGDLVAALSKAVT